VIRISISSWASEHIPLLLGARGNGDFMLQRWKNMCQCQKVNETNVGRNRKGPETFGPQKEGGKFWHIARGKKKRLLKKVKGMKRSVEGMFLVGLFGGGASH